jgi:hypothetical protein
MRWFIEKIMEWTLIALLMWLVIGAGGELIEMFV